MTAYGEDGPYGVWFEENGNARWFEHHRGGPQPFTRADAEVLAASLNGEAKPIVWNNAKQEYVLDNREEK